MTLTRRLLSGTIPLTLSGGFVRLLTIVTMPILTALLTPQAYGAAALVGTVVSLVSVFALSGIDLSYARAYYSASPPSGASVERFCWRSAMFTALAAAFIASGAWWMLNKDSDELDSHLAILLGMGIILSTANAMALTRARLAGRYREMALTIVASGTIGPAIGIGIATFWRQDAWALIVPLLLSYLIPVMVLGVPSISQLTGPSDLKRGEGVALFTIGLAGLVTAPMYWLVSSSDRWVLHYYHGAKVVGIYSIGYSVAIVGMMINSSIISVWLPEASREYELNPAGARNTLGRLMSRLIVAMAVIWLAVVAAGGDVVRLLANERFHAAADVVPYIAAGVFFYGASQLALYQLVLVNQFKWAALWWFVTGLACTSLNWALVPRYGGVGAAMTQSVSFAFIFTAMLATSQAKYRLQMETARLVASLTIVIISGFAMIPSWHSAALRSLLVKLPIGITISMIVAWLIAPDWCARGGRSLLRKLGGGATARH